MSRALVISGAVVGTMAAALAVGSASSQAAAPRVTRATPKVLVTPHVRIDHDPKARLAPGYIFAGPKFDMGAPPSDAKIGPEIMDAQGRAVYFDQTPSIAGVRATDVRAQQYHGKRVLTYWQGHTPKGPDGNLELGVGVGTDYILDQNYRVIKKVQAKGIEDHVPIKVDQHEFLLTSHNTALITSYAVTRRDARAEGGAKNQAVLDGIAEEINLDTNKVVFRWHSINHVGLKNSLQPAPRSAPNSPWDYFHINAVKLDSDGNVIVSSRHTSSVYKVNHGTGKIIWTLSAVGKKSDFRMLGGVTFSWQHDPEPLGNNTYRIFDNASTTTPNIKPTSPNSRVLTLKLNLANHTASKVGLIRHQPGVLATSQGDSQSLPAGHLMVGWGSTNRMSEYNAKHQQIWNAKFDTGFNTYRAYKSPWVGTPGGHPSLTISGSGSNRQVDVVWNGATRVHKWRIMGGSTRGNVKTIASTPWNGLDTAFKLSSYPKFMRVAAVDAHGHVLAYTNTKST